MVLRMSAAQHRALETFIADRENPQSPGFHLWLTPDEFGEQFGASQEKAAKVAAWLRASGMTEVSISRGRLFVVFSGTADAVERAMGCRIHVFALNGKSHFANLDSPQLPSDLGDDVAQVVGLDDFTALPQRVRAPQTQYVTASGMTALGPDDLATIYNTIGLYNQGIDGSGITVAVLGQTPLALSDYRAYRQLFGLAANDFQTAEFPGSGTGTGSADDQMEATLDLETIGALARGANILYVWGSTVEVAAVYVIDNQLAQIMSQSYAACETGSESFYQMIALQANAEGITWLSAAGDSGAAGCDAMEAPTASFGLNVMVPPARPMLPQWVERHLPSAHLADTGARPITARRDPRWVMCPKPAGAAQLKCSAAAAASAPSSANLDFSPMSGPQSATADWFLTLRWPRLRRRYLTKLFSTDRQRLSAEPRQRHRYLPGSLRW